MPHVSLDRRRLLVGAVLIVAVLALAGRLLLRPTSAAVPPPVRVAAAPRTTTPALLFVHVAGAVRRPGLYRMHAGVRVADAVGRAGGPTRKAQLELVNLAAPLADGQQIVVPRRGAVAVATPGASAGPQAGPVHLNSATLEQLDALPGVGPVTAQKILDYREAHGPFTTVDELDAIVGIGPARLGQLRELVAP